ncbi:MAG: hypothetical protein ACM3Q2_00135, partial [Syntrophothermus sp.]
EYLLAFYSISANLLKVKQPFHFIIKSINPLVLRGIMSEVAAGVEKGGPEILHYYYFRSTSVKLVRQDDRYLVIMKKYILYLFRRIKRFEYSNYNDAEDKYLEIKSMLQYQGRFN